jgi:hypothetical protein
MKRVGIAGHPHGALPVGGAEDLPSLVPQGHRQQFRQRALVVDHEDPHPLAVGPAQL